nr:MAG TPA: hypothetical protein [Caudoviricetes sp.]
MISRRWITNGLLISNVHYGAQTHLAVKHRLHTLSKRNYRTILIVSILLI